MARMNKDGTPDKRGGARVGAGRLPGKSPKRLREAFFDTISTETEVAELKKMWKLFKDVATDKARNGETEDMQWIFSRILPIPKEQEQLDITSNGESITQTIYGFTHKETDDFK